MNDVDGQQDPPLTLRQPGRWLIGGVYGVLIVVWVLTFVSHGRGVSTFELGLLLACIVLIAVAGVLALVSRVRMDGHGVSSVNQFGRRHRLAWHEVHHFEVRGYWRGLGVWTTDGRWIRLMQYGTYDRTAADYLTRLENFRWHQQQTLGLV